MIVSSPDAQGSKQEFLKRAARDIFSSTLAQCSVEQAFARKVRVNGSLLWFDEEVVDFNLYDRIRIVAVGKAAAPMLAALLRLLPVSADCDMRGVIDVPQRPEHLPNGFDWFAGGHPLPNQDSLNAALAAQAMLTALPRDAECARKTLCIFLISGGASAMMEQPLDSMISREDTAAFHRILVHSGASIAEINCVRKHFSAIKGGRLALAAPRGATLLAFFVSDVPALQLAELGSGPVLPDPTTVEQCRAVIEHYGLLEQFPASVRSFFQQASLPETPKPGAFPLSACTVLDSNELILAARARAEELGFRVSVDNTCDDWDYKAAARYLLERLQAHRLVVEPEEGVPAKLPGVADYVCLLSAGEVTVRVDEPAGTGGRNQQLALYAATQMKPEDAPIVFLSAGSDGVDGNSFAAGGVAESNTLARAAQLGLDAENALARFDAHPVLDAFGDTIVTGPTGNNLRDLRILLASVQTVAAPGTKTAAVKPSRARRGAKERP